MNGKPVPTVVYHPEDLPDDVRSRLYESSERICKESGKIYINLGNTVISCPDDSSGNEMVHELMLSITAGPLKPDSARDVYSMVFRDPSFTPDQTLLKKFRIKPSVPRVTAVYSCLSGLKDSLFSLFSEIVPLESGDVIIPYDFQTVIMIKDMDSRSEEEMIEYAEAVIGTMESEGISEIRVGIGTKTDDLNDLRRSFQEGREALRLGMKYHRRDHIYLYSEFTLERIVDCFPEEEMNRIRSIYFRTNGLSAFNDEMLETVRCFMKNDLNLTAASRQLFIHRNTLNYRLDKIKKETGLDLRSFQDAVIFKLISMVPEEDKD